MLFVPEPLGSTWSMLWTTVLKASKDLR